VLVIDSNLKHKQLLCDALEQCGFKKDNLICLSSLSEGKAYMESEEGDAEVIFLEVSEPDSEEAGYNMYSAVKHWAESGKAVFVSAFIHDLGTVSRRASIRGEHFFSKPLRVFELHRIMQRWIRSRLIDFVLAEPEPDCHCMGDSGHVRT
jgi:DNA-binding NtrC family response regulator